MEQANGLVVFLTAVVGLLAAIVGLYKVARFGHGGHAATSDSGKTGGPLSDFAPLLIIPAFLLGWPAMMWAYVWLLHRVEHTLDDSAPPDAVILTDSTRAGLMFEAALRMPERQRDAALAEAITAALDGREYRLAVTAASRVSEMKRRGSCGAS